MDPRVLPFAELAPRLRELGYAPVPIAPGTKAPPRRCARWQDPDQRWSRYVQLRAWTGLLTYATPAVDLDVRHLATVRRLIKLADDTLGRAPTRVGASPKTLLLYRADELFNKLTSRPFSLPGDDLDDPAWAPHKIEVLASGQQAVAYAVHPGTGQPYRWGRGEPLRRPWGDLAPLSEAVARGYVKAAEHLLEDELGALFVRRRAGEWLLDEREPSGRGAGWSKAQGGNPAYWWCWDANPEDVAEVLELRQRRAGWAGRCPVHGSYSGKPASISDVFQMRAGDDGALIFTCFAGCEPDEVAEEVSLKLEEYTAEHVGEVPYDYSDFAGLGAEEMEEAS